MSATDTIDVAALVERLGKGVQLVPISGNIEVADTDAADALMEQAATALQSQADALAEARETNRKLNRRNQQYEHAFVAGLRSLDEMAKGGSDRPNYSKAFLQVYHLYDVAKTRATTAEASLATMREALEELVDTLTPVSYPAMKDPAHHDEIKRLGDRIGYGALMAGASAAWREATPHKGSEFVAGPCYSVLKADYDRARRALGGSNAE